MHHGPRRRTISLVVTPFAVAIAARAANSSGVTRAWIVADRATGFLATGRKTERRRLGQRGAERPRWKNVYYVSPYPAIKNQLPLCLSIPTLLLEQWLHVGMP